MPPAPNGPTGGARVFRSPGMVGMCAVVSGGIGAMLAGYAAVERPVLVKAFCLAGLLVAIWLTVRVVRSGIVVDSTGVEVRGFARTRRVRWEDVGGFRVLPGSALNRSVYLAVELTNGSTLRTSGLTAATSGQYAKRVLADLESLRRDAANRAGGTIR